jgi:glycosyltransferase involved in cell wall biosynthesis
VDTAILELAARDFAVKRGRLLAAVIYAVKARVARLIGSRASAVRSAMIASRYSDGSACRDILRQDINEVKRSVIGLLPVPRPVSDFERRTVILADPDIRNGQVVRKGVLLVSFSETCGLLFASVDRSKLARLFHLVLEPSSSGYADPDILGWLSYPEPVIVQSSELRDRELLTYISSNLVPVDYGAGDWIQPPEITEVADGSKRFDSLCVANYGWWKRAHVFVRAVAQANKINRGHRAALVLARLGKTADSEKRLRRIIKAYGAESLITMFEGLNRDELSQVYARSRVFVFPSLKEGSSRVIYEAMCHDVPVMMLDSNVGVNKKHINGETGWLVRESRLGRELAKAAATRAPHLRPRDWFLRNLGPKSTTNRLRNDLNRLFPHEDWGNAPLRVKANTPEARLLEAHGEYVPLSSWLANDL